MVFTCLLLFAALLPCLSHSASVNVGIVNGTEAEPHSRPYMVSLQQNGKHECGGFLVSENFVMSAAHCWKNGVNLTVVTGAHDLDNYNYFRIPVKFYHVYPGYRRVYNDIMLLQLEKPAQRSRTVEWISIPKTNKDVEANTICSVAGWGKTAFEGPYSSRLFEADVSVIETKTCKRDWGQYFSDSNMLCAGSGRGFCQGDSGGPLVCNNIAVGIVSFFESGNCDKPTVEDNHDWMTGYLFCYFGLAFLEVRATHALEFESKHFIEPNKGQIQQPADIKLAVGFTDITSVKMNHYMINRKSRVFEGECLLLDVRTGTVCGELTSPAVLHIIVSLTEVNLHSPYSTMALISLLLLAALLPQLGHSASIHVGIVNGKEAKPHSRPYMVSLQAGTPTKHFCGGFLVSEQFVMTAAHCKYKVKQWTDVTAVIGAQNLMTDSFQHIQLTEQYSHPDFTNDPNYPENDIMLLKLAKPVVSKKILIPEIDEDFKQNVACSVAGWGRIGNDGPANDVLLEANVTMLSSRECKRWWNFNNILCTDRHHGGFCAGDSGGPLVCNNIAVGVIAFYEKTCVNPPTPYGYTKISGFLPWIKKILGKMK
ncbi:hypothetical protein AOLI_G00150170 [Acnodon oligacanthus]